MAEQRKTPSLRAIDEVKEILYKRCLEAHYATTNYGELKMHDRETGALSKGKKEIITRISKEIEEYAVKKYEKFGLAIVPVCHRKENSSGCNRLNIDLKIKMFPGTEELEKAKNLADVSLKEDLRKITDWHFAALKAIAGRESMPDVPEFKPYGEVK